jgi:hypothetical protein
VNPTTSPGGGKQKLLPADTNINQVQVPSTRGQKFKPALLRGKYAQALKQYSS